jgi:hypothetical protein
MMSRTKPRTALALALLVAGSGCFEYSYVPLAQARPGSDVRIQLSEEGLVHLAAATFGGLPHLSRTLEGTLVEADSRQLVVAVRVWSGGAGAENQIEQRVAIPAADVVAMERRQLDKQKTGGIAAAVGVAVVVLVARQLSGIFGGTTTSTPPNSPAALVAPRI